MPTSARRAASDAGQRAPKKPADPGPKPYLRFRHSHELRARTLKVLVAVEKAERPTAHAEALGGLIVELTEVGMDQYFLQPLKATKPNFVVQQSAALGLAGVQQAMGLVVRNIVSRMDDRQLLVVCSSIRRFME
jgi:hypothetical protein